MDKGGAWGCGWSGSTDGKRGDEVDVENNFEGWWERKQSTCDWIRIQY